MARLVAPPPPPDADSGGPLRRPRALEALPPVGTPPRRDGHLDLLTPPAPPTPPPTRRQRSAARRGAAAARLRAGIARVRAVPRRWVTATLVLLVLVAGGMAYWAARPDPPIPLSQKDIDASIAKAQDDAAKAAAAAPADATVAYTTIQPSLVLITVARPGGAGTGAGVIVNADGTILTANHVTDGATSITVSYSDGSKSSAKVASSQPQNDIATLAPQTLPTTLVPATLGGGLEVGAPVFAVGHPLGFVDSLSAGVVSALDRTVPVQGGRTLQHLIQIDAAVNPGNSGGPLLDKAGNVVGIVTGLANPDADGSFAGIGFAVPIETAGGAAGSPSQ